MFKNQTYYTNNNIEINILKYFITGYKPIGYKKIMTVIITIKSGRLHIIDNLTEYVDFI